MKQLLDATQWSDLTSREEQFVLLWKKRKYHDQTPTLNLGQILELIVATTHNLHFEDSDGRYFNYSLQNDESTISWDGHELIDILWYEAVKAVRHRLATSHPLDQQDS